MMLLLKRKGLLIVIAFLALITEYSSSPLVLGCRLRHRRRESEDDFSERSDIYNTEEESSRAGLIENIASIVGSRLHGAGGPGGLGFGGLGGFGGPRGPGGPSGPGGEGGHMGDLGRAFGSEAGKIMSSPEITGLIKSLTSTMTGAMKDSSGQVTSTITNMISKNIENSVEEFIKNLQEAGKPREDGNGGGNPSMYDDRHSGRGYPQGGYSPNSFHSNTGYESGNGLDEGEGEGDVPPPHYGPGPSDGRPPLDYHPGMRPPVEQYPSGTPPVDRPQDERRPPGFPPAGGPIGGNISPDPNPIKEHPIADPTKGLPEGKNPSNSEVGEGPGGASSLDLGPGRESRPENQLPDHKEPIGGDLVRDHEKPHIQPPSPVLRKLKLLDRRRILDSILAEQRSVLNEINRRDDFGDDEFDPEKVRLNTHRNSYMRNYVDDELNEVPKRYSLMHRPRRNIMSSKIFIGAPLDYKDQASFPIGGSLKRGTTRQILTIV